MPSGVWHPDEYAKLVGYDGEIAEQTRLAAFYCHHDDGQVCAGWLGHRDPADLLAVRLGVARGTLHADVGDYSTSVPLWDSGAAAAAHGLAEVEDPDERAQATIDKLVRSRAARRG